MKKEQTVKQEEVFTNTQVGALADAFGKSPLTIRRWVAKKDDRLTSERAKKALALAQAIWQAEFIN